VIWIEEFTPQGREDAKKQKEFEELSVLVPSWQLKNLFDR
jgi:hypothetical protein